MCWACDDEQLRYPPERSYVTYPLGKVSQGTRKKYLERVAREQRENLETVKFYRFLCDRHLDHYEQVVNELEQNIGV